MESHLEGNFSTDEATILVDLASKCLQYEPKDRPSIKDIVATLAPLQTKCDVPSHVMFGISKQEEAPSTPPRHLSPLGEACSRKDLTAIHQILVMTHYRDDDGTGTIELKLDEMQTAHVVSIGSEAADSLTPDLQDGKGTRLTLDSHINFALFNSFTAADYVAAQRLRRRIMYYHTQIFKNVDVIVTPTTGMTAPKIPKNALELGESDMKVTGNLMRFILAANLLGFPAISIPVGYDKQGLPIGLQIIGRPWAEATILRLAAAFEGLRVETKQPASYFDILKRN